MMRHFCRPVGTRTTGQAAMGCIVAGDVTGSVTTWSGAPAQAVWKPKVSYRQVAFVGRAYTQNLSGRCTASAPDKRQTPE